MCFRAVGQHGAILADEMGLGKTLQSVALAWTLLKQGPYGGKPITKRVLVVTPGSLVQNWGAEFNKWLGRERISVFTVDQVRAEETENQLFLVCEKICSFREGLTSPCSHYGKEEMFHKLPVFVQAAYVGFYCH